MFRKPLIVLILLCLPAFAVFSQHRQGQGQGPRRVISGKVIDSTDNQPMPMVQVGISEQNNWTVTNMEGLFSLHRIPDGKHVLTIRCLGYTTIEKEFTFPDDKELNIKLIPASLALGEVVVTAQRGTGISTSTTIGRSAIEHTQPSDLTDILQLLPGQVTENPNISSVSQLSVREIRGSDGAVNSMASLGTSLVIDGAPVSNIANTQMLSTATGGSAYQSTAMQGVDVRQFSVDNIESIEVIRGIPGAEEGEVLSGVVRINLVKGRTPLTARVKVHPSSKEGSIGKGFNLPGDKTGTLNLDMSFAQDQADIRHPNQKFNRLSANAAYNNTFFTSSRPLAFSFSTRYADSRNLRRSDPDKLAYEYYENNQQDVSITLSGRWALNSAVLTNLNFNLSGNTSRQETNERALKTFSGYHPQRLSLEEGEFEMPYLAPRYISDVNIHGRPFNINSSLTGVKTFDIGDNQNTIRAGIDYRVSGNEGRGSTFDRSRPPDPTSSAGVRERPFYTIPSLRRLSMFIQDELTLAIGSTELELQAGVRYTNVQPEGLFTTKDGRTTLDPRTNLRYRIFKRRNHFLSDLSIRLGYGRLTTTPTLLHMYPDKAYFDRGSFNYFDPPNSLFVVTTQIIEDTRNYDLKLAESNKFEAGLDITLGGVDMQFTGYMEHYTNGWGSHRNYFPFVYNVYESPGMSGLSPRYLPGTGVVYDDPVTGQEVILPSSPDTLLRSYGYPENTHEQTKMGIEFDVDFGRLDIIHTSFNLNGAYMFNKYRSTKDYYSTVASVSDQVVGLYPAGQGNTNQRLNSNLRTVTHIRPLAMVVSMTAQIIWMVKSNNIYEDTDGNPIVYTQDGSPDPYNDLTQRKYYDPVGYIDATGTYFPWTPDLADRMPYSVLIDQVSNVYHFVPITDGPTIQLNMRLTKELSQQSSISFSVNNLTNYQPIQKRKGRIDSYNRRNNPIYFSGELTIKI